MTAAVAINEDVRAVHVLAGRVRVRVPGCETFDPRYIEQQLRRLTGVRKAQVNPVTSNALVYFDSQITDVPAILDGVRSIDVRTGNGRPAASEPVGGRPVALRHRVRHRVSRARISVRGMDRDPLLAGHVVSHLQRQPGVVRVIASTLTSRVLVEFSEDRTDVGDLISSVVGIELPAIPDEDRPSHPLDSAPLLQSAARVSSAGIGLGLLAVRQLVGTSQPIVDTAAPAAAATILGILQGFPVTRNGLRAAFGRHLADLAFEGAAIVSLALSGNPLGLMLAGAEALGLLTEVVARRRAWRRFEDLLGDGQGAHAGAEIRIESGGKAPLRATVIEGAGTATGLAGLPEHIAPSDTVQSGSRLYGGPFVLQCQPHKAFLPEPRPAPPRPGLYDRYWRGEGWLSLAYAGLTALLTRSFTRTFIAFVLVNPRTAVVGADAAELRASARVLRGNVTVVGTRPDRKIHLPDLLLLDGPRVLTDGFELQGIVALNAAHTSEAIAAYAAGVAAAVNSPWGMAFSPAESASATNGSLSGKEAAADIAGVRYSLSPLTIGDAVSRELHQQYRGSMLLALRSELERDPIGVFALRPRLAAGTQDLVEACALRGVEVTMLGVRNAAAGQLVARRAGIEYSHDHDALQAIRTRQSKGGTVAFLSDNAGAGPAFAECDLAIGLSSEHTHHFPARADLLASDLHGVTAIVEAGARSRAAVMDAVALSAVANGIGVVWGLRGPVALELAPQVTFVTALGAITAAWLRLRGSARVRANQGE
jgi:cation-transporting ATPase I